MLSDREVQRLFEAGLLIAFGTLLGLLAYASLTNRQPGSSFSECYESARQLECEPR